MQAFVHFNKRSFSSFFAVNGSQVPHPDALNIYTKKLSHASRPSQVLSVFSEMRKMNLLDELIKKLFFQNCF
jgi:hypothetical protein